MTSNKFKKVFRRRYLKRLSQFEQLSDQTSDNFEKNFIKRLSRLENVRLFTATWILGLSLLIFLVAVQTLNLSNYFQTLQPVPGGNLNEGILGGYSNSNPIYASSAVDQSVSSLVFAGLMRYDNNNHLVGSLASSYTVDSSGLNYTFILRPNLKWQDGKQLTSSDVKFTFDLIKSPDAQSPLFSSWQGIIITTPNISTVVFSLPNPLSSFPYSLTTGILPEHILKSIQPANMRTIDFDTITPIGSGPFKLTAVKASGTTPQTSKQTIELSAYGDYWQGRPKLDQIRIQAFNDQSAMTGSFDSKTIDSMSGLTDIPASKNKNTIIYSFPFTAANMIFFKTSSGVLADKNVRNALLQATNQKQIISSLSYKTKAVNEPLLEDQLGYNKGYAQHSFNLSNANTILNSDGWIMSKDGYRYKGGTKLSISLTSSDSAESLKNANLLKSQWKAVGLDLKLNILNESNLQYSISYHNYQALLYGISLGVDPDVYVYWDSSQADPRSPFRLNLSEYSSASADGSLQAGRTRLDPGLRVIKYQPFLTAWQSDAPAVGLYQPRYLYLSNSKISGLAASSINSSTDRYNNVVNWEIRQAKVTN